MKLTGPDFVLSSANFVLRIQPASMSMEGVCLLVAIIEGFSFLEFHSYRPPLNPPEIDGFRGSLVSYFFPLSSLL